jgi:sterol desaturase/sphingolipid hydroxylase (fatty acid hydroxylase superfamily)
MNHKKRHKDLKSTTLYRMFRECFWFVLCYDVWFYLIHVCLHDKRLYPFHKEHHSTPYQKLQLWDTYRAHWIENATQGLGIFIPLLFFPKPWNAFVVSYIGINVRGLMRHDSRFVWLIGNHHLLHHKNMNYNFGEYWIDVCMGTQYPHESEYHYGMLMT